MIPEAIRWFRLVRMLVPGVSVLFVVVLTAIPVGIPYLPTVTPFFALIAVYFWGIYRPDLLPIWAVFALGALQDLLTGAPLGVTSLALVLVYALAVSQRRIVLGQSFGVEWAGFMLVAAGAGIVVWLVGSAFRAAFLWTDPFAVQTMLTAALYPVFSWTLAQVARLAPPAQPG